MPRIRNVAICVFRHQGRILVAPGFDHVKNEHFFRPLGGEVEFGELASEAVRREIREELGAEIRDPVLLGVLENRFEYQGLACHEVVFVFDAAFKDPRMYARTTMDIDEDGWSGSARWIDAGTVAEAIVYPSGIVELLDLGRSPAPPAG